MYTKMRCLTANTKHEDAIMKMGFGYFRESILKRLGINYEFVAEEPTELIEFQTTETDWKDLLRFEAYEAVTAHKRERKVLTYVIYSDNQAQKSW